jgi:hypothetical protein
MTQEKSMVDKKIKRKIKIFIFMFLLSVCLAIYHITQDILPAKYPLTAFAIGLVLGALLSRIQKITWDKDGEKIIKQFDIISGLLLFFVILFFIFKDNIIMEIVSIKKINSLVFSLNAGMMLGRVLLIRHQIGRILRDKR